MSSWARLRRLRKRPRPTVPQTDAALRAEVAALVNRLAVHQRRNHTLHAQREQERARADAATKAAEELGDELQRAEDRIVRARAALSDPGLSSSAQVRAALAVPEEGGTDG